LEIQTPAKNIVSAGGPGKEIISLARILGLDSPLFSRPATRICIFVQMSLFFIRS